MSKENITKLVQATDRVRDPAVEAMRDTFDKTFDVARLAKEGMAYFLKWRKKYFQPVLKGTYQDAVKAGRDNAV